MSEKLPQVAIRSIETIRRTKIMVPGHGELRGHLFAEALEDATKPSQFLGRNIAANLDGSASVPKSPSAILAKHVGGGLIDVSIQDQPLHPAVNYFVELSNNPGFSGARVVHSGPSRNATVMVPNGKWYLRAYSQYHYSGSPSNSGDPAPATSVVVSGSLATGTLLPSQGSGTGSGQTPGAGFGTLTPVKQSPGAPPIQRVQSSAAPLPSAAASGGAILFQSTIVLGSDVVLSAGVLSSLLAITVGMPASSALRALVSYGVLISGGGVTVDAWVTDGTNIYATSQSGLPGTDVTGQNGFAPSTAVYAPGQIVTFTLNVQSNGTPTIKAAPIEAGQNTWLSVLILADAT